MLFVVFQTCLDIPSDISKWILDAVCGVPALFGHPKWPVKMNSGRYLWCSRHVWASQVTSQSGLWALFVVFQACDGQPKLHLKVDYERYL